MNNINEIVEKLEFAQIGWVVPDITAVLKFFMSSIPIAGFPKPAAIRAQDIGLSYHGRLVNSEWLTSQVYNGGTFIELIQPVSGQNMFQDYLDRNPSGGVQHVAYRLAVAHYDRTVANLRQQGYAIIAAVDHPIARMSFFDTYKALGVATEIMGITPQGWAAIAQMKK